MDNVLDRELAGIDKDMSLNNDSFENDVRNRFVKRNVFLNPEIQELKDELKKVREKYPDHYVTLDIDKREFLAYPIPVDGKDTTQS